MFRQTLVHEGPAGLVTLLERADTPRPMVVDGRTLLEPDSPIVWFTFPGARHDIGRFHTADGAFTGLYANILTPVEREGDDWRTTDLFLDVLLEPGLPPRILDGDELEEAVAAGWIGEEIAREAEEEARRLIEEAEAGEWPPPIVDAWTLDRARATAAGHPSPGSGVSRANQRRQPED